MPATITAVSGHFLTLKAGMLTRPEISSMQTASAAMFGAEGPWRVLVQTDN